ncbi:hypothetical protein OS493_006959, partial [Desmophyllum pertusum]
GINGAQRISIVLWDRALLMTLFNIFFTAIVFNVSQKKYWLNPQKTHAATVATSDGNYGDDEITATLSLTQQATVKHPQATVTSGNGKYGDDEVTANMTGCAPAMLSLNLTGNSKHTRAAVVTSDGKYGDHEMTAMLSLTQQATHSKTPAGHGNQWQWEVWR